MTKPYNEMSMTELESEMFNIYSAMEEIGAEWARFKALYELSVDSKKTKLASIIDGNLKSGSFSDREVQARASDDWKMFMADQKRLYDCYFNAQVGWDVIRARHEGLRTIISNRREEIKKFNG